MNKTKSSRKFVICRTYSAGVFAGYIEKNAKELTIYQSRRIWRWVGAASLSQLAIEGTKEPENCKFPCVVPETFLTEVIEIINCTYIAEKSILGVPIWSA